MDRTDPEQPTGTPPPTPCAGPTPGAARPVPGPAGETEATEGTGATRTTGPTGTAGTAPGRAAHGGARSGRPGPRGRLGLAVLGLSLLAAAGLCLMVVGGAVGLVNGGLLLIGAPLAILGAGVAISALERRRAGWMGLLGWPALMVALPALVAGAAVPASVRAIPHDQVEQVVGRSLHRSTYTWQDMVDSGSGSTRALPAVAVGEVVLDLSDMPQDWRDAGAEGLRTIDLEVGAGAVRILLPQDQPIVVDARATAGRFWASAPQDWTLRGGDGPGSAEAALDAEKEYTVDGAPSPTPTRTTGTLLRPAQLRSPAGGDPLTIRVRMGAGEIGVSTAQPASWAGDASQKVWIVAYWRDESGRIHIDEADPSVPGMTHPAISARQAEECLARAERISGTAAHDPDDIDDLTDDADWQDVAALGGQERESYDACVQGLLEDRASGDPGPGTQPRGPGGVPTPGASPSSASSTPASPGSGPPATADPAPTG